MRLRSYMLLIKMNLADGLHREQDDDENETSERDKRHRP